MLAIKSTENVYGQNKSQAVRTAAYDESRQLFDAIIEDPRIQPYQRALAEYYDGLAELKFRHAAFGAVGLSRETRDRVEDALDIFQSSYRALKPSVEIKEMEDNIANARKALSGATDKSAQDGDIDWVVIR